MSDLRAPGKRDPVGWHRLCAPRMERWWWRWHDATWLEREGDPLIRSRAERRVGWLKTQAGAAGGRLHPTIAVLDGLHLYFWARGPPTAKFSGTQQS